MIGPGAGEKSFKSIDKKEKVLYVSEMWLGYTIHENMGSGFHWLEAMDIRNHVQAIQIYLLVLQTNTNGSNAGVRCSRYLLEDMMVH